jgi:hypothetical protein
MRPLRLSVACTSLLLAACASLPREPVSSPIALAEPEPLVVVGKLPDPPPPPPAENPGSDIVMRALGLTGVRYRYGGNTPTTGFDCSGFVRWVFRDVDGIELPRSSGAMARIERPAVEPDELAPGDLVFFRIRGQRVSHVGIYVGEGRFVHAPSRGGKVRVDEMDDAYWKRRYAGARRVLDDNSNPASANTASAG